MRWLCEGGFNVYFHTLPQGSPGGWGVAHYFILASNVGRTTVLMYSCEGELSVGDGGIGDGLTLGE